KMTFDREIPRYTDALSSEEKIDRPVPRKISRNSAAPVFGTGTNLFSRADDNENADFDGGDIDNPEFIQLVPPPLNALANESAEDAYERYLRDVLIDDEGNGDIDSINVEDVIKRVGENFKKSFRFDKTAKVKQSSARAFEVQVAGSLPPQSPSQDYSPFPVAAPSWLITYKEKDHVMTLGVSAKGAIFSQRLGRLPFTEDFFFSEKYEIDSDVQDRISHLNEAVFGHNSKPEIFSSLLQEKLSPALMWQPEDRFDATGIAVNTPFDSGDYFKPKYDEFVNRFLNTAGIRVSNNRLLKKIPNKSLSNLAPLGDAGPTFGAKPNTETLLVNLINFSAAPTEAQRRCKADPHILDLEFVKSIVKEEFEKDCEHESNNDGISRSRSPINSSGYVGVVLTIVRLYAVESVLKGLFVFDEYGYKEDFANDQLFISYISRKMIKDIERQGDFADGANYFKEFEREAKIAHEKMVSSKQIEPDGLGALESLIKFQLKSVLNKVRDLVGTNPSEAEGSIIRSLLTALPVIPVYSNFDFGFGGGGTYESANSRLDFIEPKGDFVIEKYIRIPKVISHSPPSDAEIAQNHTGLHGVVNLKNWDEFILTNQGLADEQISSLFPAPWKYGYRLVYVTSIEGESRRETELPTREYIFGNRSIPLRGDLVDKEKAFHVYEKSIIEEQEVEGETKFGEIKTYTQYNTIPIAEVEIKIDNFMDKMKDSKEKIEQNFDLIYEEQLLALLEQELDTRTLFDYCFFANRLFALLFINSSLALNTEDMRMLFEGTKGELKRLFAILRNMGDYTSKSDAQFLDGVPGNASAFKADFDSIGSPSGPRGPDAFYLASITPILILRGLAELTDPNIAITSKIVAAGNAGYLLPKFARDLRGDIRPNDLGLPIIQKTPVGVLDPNGYECILRESDDLPSFVDDFTEMDWDSNEVPNFPGAEIVEGKLRIDRGPNRELYGLDRSVFSENPQAIVQSIPEFPGESVNLPYGLVSLALLPLQVFFPILGPFTGPPNTPLGKLFLQLEPLIYQLPSYKYALVETDVAKEILLSEGIDLSGAKKFKCDDGAESEPEPKTLPSSNPAPEGVDSC
ncbi:MAG TPA: hypothetical protein VMW36_09850, partial [Patescibacteria group bacterium]|nr:hypothetical protein [Patescibacteria group bacterium]